MPLTNHLVTSALTWVELGTAPIEPLPWHMHWQMENHTKNVLWQKTWVPPSELHLKKYHNFRDGWAPDKRWTQTKEGGPIPQSYTEWIEATARPRRWIYGPTLVTAATRLSRNLIIFQWTQNSWKQVAFLTPIESHKQAFENAGHFPPLPLFLKADHYTTIIPTEKPFPAEWNHAKTTSWDIGDHRGGGKSTATHAKETVKSLTSKSSPAKSFRSWLPPSTPAKSLKSWLPATPFVQTTKQSECSKRAASSVNAASSSRLSKHVDDNAGTDKSEKQIWTCPFCSLGIEADIRRQLSKKRACHFQTRHPNVDRSGSRLKMVDKVTPTPNLPREQRGWTCAFCTVGLPDGLPRTVKEYAIKEHYRVKHPRRDTSLSAIHKARAKQYKKDPLLHPNILAAKKRLSTALSRFQNAAPKADVGGHLLEVIRPNWSTWPSLKANRKRFGTMTTCVNCWRVANQDWHVPCRPEP